MKKIILFFIVCFLTVFTSPAVIWAEPEGGSDKEEGVYVIGALMKTITIVESEIALQFSFAASAVADHIDLSKKIKETVGPGSVPGLVRISGGSMEVMLDIESAFLEEVVGDGAIKIYDFNLGAEDGGTSVVVLPEGSVRSFTIAIGAKAEILNGENIDYFTKNVLSANYL